MTDSFDDFMNDDPYGEESTGSTDFVTIALASVEPAYQGWADNEVEVFVYKHSADKLDEQRAIKECQEYIDSGRPAQYKQYPAKGLLTVIFGEDVPSHPEGQLPNGNWLDFVQAFHNNVEQNKRLTSDEFALTDPDNSMPYDLVLDGIKNNRDVFCNQVWCKLIQKTDQYRKAKGKKNNKGYDYRVYVVDKIYISREDALADNEIEKMSEPSKPVDIQLEKADIQLSKTAIDTWGTGDNKTAINTLFARFDEIHAKILEEKKKHLLAGSTPNEAKVLAIADVAKNDYVIEPEDYHKLQSLISNPKIVEENTLSESEIPF